MASLLDAPKPAPKVEEFVEKQLTAARRRVRLLDFFLVGLGLAGVSLVFLLAALIVDRYVETPRGTGWAVIAGYLGLATGFIYWALFRTDRRDINPYFAARQVEQNVPDAKNSLVTFIDFEEDPKLPGSIRTAISQKAARDLKKVDLNRAIENRKIIWLAVAAGVLVLACAIVAFLPPTRTELSLEQPKNGDITVFNNQELNFEVHVRGRIPSPTDPDAVRLRMWYNPDDPDSYEERPLKPSENDRRQFTLAVPPKQVRNGFHYRVLAGNTHTPEYTVTCKIIPEFTGFDVSYEYPPYLKRAAEQNNDPNLVAPYGAVATLTVSTNREVKHGHIEIEGQARTIDGRLIEGRPDAIEFTVPMDKDGFYRVWYTTPEGDKNQDPARMRMTVIDPKPDFRTFDIAYDYPAYLRFKPMTAADVRQPEIEAPRGTKVVLTAKTTRGVKEAKLELEGQPPVIGEPVPDQPMWVRFKLPAIDKDTTARVSFTPTTNEQPNAPRSIPVRALIDQAPSVKIIKPDPEEVQIPANGTLDVTGEATDDHGVDKLTLRMKVAGTDRDLKPKPYRNGMSFLRKDDNSWPTKVEYKDFVKLQDLRFEREPTSRVMSGEVIEYWLEAVDNCAVEPGPNRAESAHKRFKVTAAVTKADEQRKIDNQNKKREKDQQNFEKKQDQRNQTEKRDVQQPPPKGAENPEKGPNDQANPPQRKEGDPGAAKPQDSGMGGTQETRPDMPPQDSNPPTGNPQQDQQTEQVKNAIKQGEREQNAADAKDGPNTTPPDAKVDPSGSRPNPPQDPMGTPPAGDHTPKTDPKNDMTGENSAGGSRGGKVDNTKDEKADAKDGGEPPMPGGMPEEKGGDKQSFGGTSDDASKPKPDAKQPAKGGPEPKAGPEPKGGDEKAGAHPDTKPDPTNPQRGTSTAKGGTKPEPDVKPAETKRGSDEPGPTGDKPPSDAAAEKPKEAEGAGGSRPQPKKEEVTDNGGSRRGPPKDDDSAGGDRPQPKDGSGGSKEDIAKGGNKGGPGTPQGPNSEQSELDRDLGELDREINSPNPKVDDRKKSDVQRLMRNKETREKTRQKLDELERNAKDPLTRDKAHDLRNSGEQAAKDYDNERPNQDNMDRLSKTLNSQDKREREDAEQRLKDWQNNPETKKELDEQNDRLAKKDPKSAEQIKDAMTKNEQARNQAGNGSDQKLDEKDLQQMAKDLNGSDEKAKADAKQNLQKMMQDPKTRQQAQEKLNEMAKNAQGQDKKDLETAAKQAGEMANQMAGKEPGPKPEQKIDPKDIKNAAEKLANGSEKEKQEARDQLDKMMKDPKAAAEAQKQLQQMANDAKTHEEKKALEDAAKKAGELAKGNQPKMDPKDLADAAKKLANGTPEEKQRAQEHLKEMMKDPQKAEEARKQLEEMAKNAKPEDKQALQDAAKELAKEMGPKEGSQPKPEDMKNMADKLAGNDPKAKEEAQKQLKEMMKDPKAREQALKQLEEMAKNAKPEDKQALQEALKQANEMAKNQPPKPDAKDLQDLAKQLDKMDPKAKEELRKKFEDAMKDPKTKEEFDKLAKEMAKQPKTPEEQKQFEDLMHQMGGHFPDYIGKPDPADPRNKLRSAEMLLEKFNKDRAKLIPQLGWTEEQAEKWAKDQEATIAALRKQAEKGDWRTNREVKSPTAGGPTPVTLNPKDGGNLQKGGQAPPPPGYVDPYRKFTTEGSNAGKAGEPKR
jgi:hypothetical protein